LRLSNEADFDRVDGVRASCDAILVGAATLRNDNPRLLVRSPRRQRDRLALGQPPHPLKVTVTASGNLPRGADFFRLGDTEKVVFCPTATAPAVERELAGVATVVPVGACVDMRRVGEILHARGVERLLVEGGGGVHTQFLTGDLADELQLVIAPLFVGDSRARRFVDDGEFPWNADRRAELAEVRQIGDVVLLRYALSTRFHG
jgi:5-amino-6-(5-phosphoribosylamino)uracil reductase